MNCSKSHFCLDNVSIFEPLSKEEQLEIHKYVQHKHFPKNSTIYLPGVESEALYIVSSGKIRIYRLSDTGKEQLLRIIIPGEFTGELAMFKEGVFEAFAESLEDTYVCMISHEDFRQILLDYPKVAIKMLETISKRLSVSEEQTSWISTETVSKRLLYYLERSSYILDGEFVVDLDMPKKDLASYLGTTPESLSREFTKLIDNDLIKEVGNKVKLKDVSFEIKECKLI